MTLRHTDQTVRGAFLYLQESEDGISVDVDRATAIEDKWGEGLEEDEYRYLEKSYRSLVSGYKGDLTPRLELNILDICKYRLERDKAVRRNDTAAAKRYTDMIKIIMDSEAMKVGDKKQAETARVDGLVDRLEQMGLMKDGELLLQRVIQYIKIDKGQFEASRDAIDSMMLSMINAYRFNNGLSDIVELPEDLKVQDRLGEFVDAPLLSERNTMNELGMASSIRG